MAIFASGYIAFGSRTIYMHVKVLTITTESCEDDLLNSTSDKGGVAVCLSLSGEGGQE